MRRHTFTSRLLTSNAAHRSCRTSTLDPPSEPGTVDGSAHPGQEPAGVKESGSRAHTATIHGSCRPAPQRQAETRACGGHQGQFGVDPGECIIFPPHGGPPKGHGELRPKRHPSSGIRQDATRYPRCPYTCPVKFVRDESMCPPTRDDATTASI